MNDEVHTNVSLSLHPKTLEALDGYGQDTAPYIASAQTALSGAYLAIESIHKARAQAQKNTALTPDAVTLRVANYAEQLQAKVLQQIDSASTNLAKSVRETESMLTTPLEQQAGAGSVNTEIRNHVKALTSEERAKFLSDANAAGDEKTLTAVLGAPSYLSGLTPEMQQLYTRQFHERKHPDVAKRLGLMKATLEALEQRGPLVFPEVEKAVFGEAGKGPANWNKVARLREMHKQTEAVFQINGQ